MNLRWKPKHSVALSLIITYLSAALLLAAMFFARSWLAAIMHPDTSPGLLRLLLILFYVCCPAGWAAIAALLKLLHNIRANHVFTRQNVRLLRLLSWCFVFVAVAALAAFCWYPLLAVIFVAAGFMAVILRVVKNVMAQATILREEQELTI